MLNTLENVPRNYRRDARPINKDKYRSQVSPQSSGKTEKRGCDAAEEEVSISLCVPFCLIYLETKFLKLSSKHRLTISHYPVPIHQPLEILLLHRSIQALPFVVCASARPFDISLQRSTCSLKAR